MFEFKLADVGEGLHEAEILRWLVQPGDQVREDQPLVEIQTDKAAVELPSPVAGRIAELKFEAGQIAHVGQVLVVIAPAGAAAPAAGADGPAPAPAAPGPGTPGAVPAPGAAAAELARGAGAAALAPGVAAGPGRRVLAAPAVRRMALERGIDLAQVPGTGPAGRVLPRDLDAYGTAPMAGAGAPAPGVAAGPAAEAPAPAAAPATLPAPAAGAGAPATAAAGADERIPLAGLRRRISERMAQAWQIPHVTVFEDLDASGLVAMREKLQPDAQGRGVRLTFMPLVIKAVAMTLKEFPDFNATLDLERREIVRRRQIHIGFASATPEGLLVPVIRDADRQSILGLARELARLAEGARQRSLGLAELSGSTFTITNFGSFGASRGTPIINPPEVAILGVGTIAKRPWVVGDELAVRPVLPLSLSFDHRVIDGYESGQFMARLMAYLSRPELLLLELI